jgi:hypothetical protein
MLKARRKLRARFSKPVAPLTYHYPTPPAATPGDRAEQQTSTVVFHRSFERFQGGHLKVFHYFEHVRNSPAHEARIRFTPDSVWDAGNPWSGLRELVVEPDQVIRADVLFLAGLDWNRLEPEQRARPPVPVINLIQGVRHADPGSATYKCLGYPAIRICCTPQTREAVEDTGLVNGPILTVPLGIDLELLPPPLPAQERDLECVVLAIKDPPLGQLTAERIRSAGHEVVLIDEHLPREELLGNMARARVVVHLPCLTEGAYLPALESMAVGAAVVCPDCVGNRSFCRDGDTCLMPERDERAIADAALTLLSASDRELQPMLASGQEESARRTLSAERADFLEILGRVEELWAEC